MFITCGSVGATACGEPISFCPVPACPSVTVVTCPPLCQGSPPGSCQGSAGKGTAAAAATVASFAAGPSAPCAMASDHQQRAAGSLLSNETTLNAPLPMWGRGRASPETTKSTPKGSKGKTRCGPSSKKASAKATAFSGRDAVIRMPVKSGGGKSTTSSERSSTCKGIFTSKRDYVDVVGLSCDPDVSLSLSLCVLCAIQLGALPL